MTTTIAFADTTDGYVSSANANYTTMRSGSGLIVPSLSDTSNYFGQWINAGSYNGHQAFESFTYTVPSGEVVTAAYIRIWLISSPSTAVSRFLTWVEYDWGATVDTTDWRTPAQISAITTLLSNVGNVEDANSAYAMAGTDALVTRLASAGPLRVMGASDRQRVGTTPTVDEYTQFASADTSGTSLDPALVFTSVPQSRLFGVLGAQVQLSDGTHVYVESSTTDLSASPVLKHHNSVSTVTTIATLSGLPACVDLDTEIFTDTGWKRYNEVRVGDQAKALDPNTGVEVWSEVLAVREYDGQHFAYRMGGDFGDLLATQEHRWLVYRGGQLQWVLTKELMSTDAIPTPNDSIPVANLNLVTERISGIVWCPTTQYGTWLARRNGVTFYTGNKP